MVRVNQTAHLVYDAVGALADLFQLLIALHASPLPFFRLVPTLLLFSDRVLSREPPTTEIYSYPVRTKYQVCTCTLRMCNRARITCLT